jgi:para-aminobenzoate synthetase/4-amino-4-deoxychorismate lyase
MADPPSVRFDDLRTDPPACLSLSGYRRVVQAHAVDEVVPALREVEDAIGSGLWAGGFVSYGAAPAFDPALAVRRPPAGLPLVGFGLFDRAEPAALPAEAQAAYRLRAWTSSITRERFERDVERIRELIAAGETYQVNHTFRLHAPFEGDPLGLYRDLCLAQRAAYGAFVNTGHVAVASASPELFFELLGDTVMCRPMKGTARRGRWAEEDDAARGALHASVKDRAENAMIVDLIRSDLGRIASPGTVTVPSMFDVERYETVWQMTSTVRAHLPAGISVTDVFGALFPCGSVTGAPKIRTMRAIAGLEGSPRGVYTGAVGFLAPLGAPVPRARFNVAIRTVVVDPAQGRAEFGVGGGVTWDSAPAAEYDETQAKALVLTARRPEFELVEVLRFEPGCGPGGGFVLLERHLERLAGSAAYFGFAFDGERALRELSAAIAGRPGQALRVRLLLARDGSVRGAAHPLPDPSGEPLRLAVYDREPVDRCDPFLFHKTTLRDRFERARAAHPTADDVILTNDRGEVTETTIANLAFLRGGRWWTPALDCGLLPGARRAELIADGTLREAVLTREDLCGAEALALVSSVRGWRPAVLA